MNTLRFKTNVKKIMELIKSLGDVCDMIISFLGHLTSVTDILVFNTSVTAQLLLS